ncbi:11901_t:CDS:1 [Acaulospora colombiana]|uniref:11901_t:CDS:1 n=1 Tax=Acaulospora colombiana TaxID=27376 RepID=A0ACA9K8V1_9GLOM|nr:11901_t:CDS:1 [Acaulospora colombiana]
MSSSNLNKFEIITEFDYFIKSLFKVYVEDFNKQLNTEHVAHYIRNYIKKSNKNPCKVFHQLLQHKHKNHFTSLIGFFYRYGIGTKIDLKLAFELCAQAASDEIDFNIENPYALESLESFRRCNHEIGLISLGLMYLNGKGVEKNSEKAFQIFSKSAEEGSSKALSCEGYMYCNGVGTKKDEAKALEKDLESAMLGNPLGQFNLGYDYFNGKGTSKDEATGFKWYLNSANEGNIKAQDMVGDCYNNGQGVPQDAQKAFEFYMKSAIAGSGEAQCDVAYCYYSGSGTAKDDKSAFRWYLKSAENGYPFGQLQVGKCLKYAIGTKRDYIGAVYWLKKALEGGENDADALLTGITERII